MTTSSRPYGGAIDCRSDESGVGQLARHDPANWEQRLLETYQKQGKSQQHVEEAEQHAAQMGNPSPQDKKLETRDDDRDRQNVAHRAGQDRRGYTCEFGHISMP